MNIWDVIIIILIAALLAFAVWKMIKRNKSGCCSDRGGECGTCDKCRNKSELKK